MAAPKAQYREKLVAIVSRRECVYKRAGELSVTFHERGGTTECVTDFSTKKNRNGVKSVPMWCEGPDLNRYGVTTRPSNVRVCQFRHHRIFIRCRGNNKDYSR